MTLEEAVQVATEIVHPEDACATCRERIHDCPRRDMISILQRRVLKAVGYGANGSAERECGERWGDGEATHEHLCTLIGAHRKHTCVVCLATPSLTTEALDTQAKIEQAYQSGWNEAKQDSEAEPLEVPDLSKGAASDASVDCPEGAPTRKDGDSVGAEVSSGLGAVDGPETPGSRCPACDSDGVQCVGFRDHTHDHYFPTLALRARDDVERDPFVKVLFDAIHPGSPGYVPIYTGKDEDMVKWATTVTARLRTARSSADQVTVRHSSPTSSTVRGWARSVSFCGDPEFRAEFEKFLNAWADRMDTEARHSQPTEPLWCCEGDYRGSAWKHDIGCRWAHMPSRVEVSDDKAGAD